MVFRMITTYHDQALLLLLFVADFDYCSLPPKQLGGFGTLALLGPFEAVPPVL